MISSENVFGARVEEEMFKGSTDHLLLVSDHGTQLSAVVVNESALVEPIHRGERVFCGLHLDDIVVLPADVPGL
jgi:spermidine/putrescine transport system ATP-binding protein